MLCGFSHIVTYHTNQIALFADDGREMPFNQILISNSSAFDTHTYWHTIWQSILPACTLENSWGTQMLWTCARKQHTRSSEKNSHREWKKKIGSSTCESFNNIEQFYSFATDKKKFFHLPSTSYNLCSFCVIESRGSRKSGKNAEV